MVYFISLKEIKGLIGMIVGIHLLSDVNRLCDNFLFIIINLWVCKISESIKLKLVINIHLHF